MARCDCPPYDCAARVRGYLAGDRGAGDELARKFTPLVYRIVQRVLGPQRRQEWADARQAVFLRLFAKLATWEGRCPFCKWLAVVAARGAIDLTRGPEPPLPLPPTPLPAPPAARLDPDTVACLERTVAGFPAEWRQVWELRLQGVPREEIARQVGKSLRAVQYWLAEMLDRLQKCLDD
jgi:RNA polymerase sigma factor (sigma-70 family)